MLLVPFAVALLAEGVDRNHSAAKALNGTPVALLAEGVDRNRQIPQFLAGVIVALLAEGVDRNYKGLRKYEKAPCRPPRGGRG